MREKSHELKTILHKAMGLVEQMCEGGEEAERYRYGERDDYDRDGMMDNRYGMRRGYSRY